MGIPKLLDGSTVVFRPRKIGQLVHTSSLSAINGFTLFELLVAASITFLVISASMSGLVELLKINQQSESETLRREDLNRALEFMADEIRRATWVNPDATKGVLAAAPDFTLPAGAFPVLAITIPGVTKPVIYYLSTATSPWLGPNLIRRWGPPFDSDGNYLQPNQPSQWDVDPSDGLGDALVDAINNQAPDPSPSCTTGWFTNPPQNSRQGFFNCVSPDGRSVTLTLQTRIKGASGATPKVYSLSSNISARSR
jgi:type II secretory pathway pseudopilin PulG